MLGVETRFTSLSPDTEVSVIAEPSGALRALGVSAGRRSPSFPDLPTVAEAGLPGYRSESTHAVFAPARTPPDIVARLNAEINRLMKTPEVAARLDAQVLIPVFESPEEFAAQIKREIALTARIAKAAGIKLGD